MALAIVGTGKDLDAWVTGYEGSLEDLACDLANRYLTGDGLVRAWQISRVTSELNVNILVPGRRASTDAGPRVPTVY
jgi:hypothetical protein